VRQLRMVQVWIDIHRDELMANWELALAGDEPFRIASYCQELCMASGGDPFFNNAINKFYSPDYFSKSLGVM
jgi:hypothetical protein